MNEIHCTNCGRRATFKDFLIWMNQYPDNLKCPACGNEMQVHLSRLLIMLLLVPAFYFSLYVHKLVVAKVDSFGVVGNALMFVVILVVCSLLLLYVIYVLVFVVLGHR